jgi:hypothetical protein
MKTYLVAYRVHENEASGRRDLGSLYAALQSLEAFARPMESVWVVCTALTATQLYRKLAPFFEGEDRLLIVECGQDAEWRGVPLDTSVWLENEISSLRYRAARRRSA